MCYKPVAVTNADFALCKITSLNILYYVSVNAASCYDAVIWVIVQNLV